MIPIRILPLAFLIAGAPLPVVQGPPPSPVRVDPVRVDLLQDMRVVTGDLRAARRSLVAAEESGIVIALDVDEGRRVEEGQVVARLDAKRLELDRLVLEAQLKVAQATASERGSDVDQKERDLRTLQGLAERDATNPKELADAATALATAKSRLEQAHSEIFVLEARVNLLLERIRDTQVRAPFPGVVAAMHTELGQWLEEGDTVVETVSDELEAWLEVPQRFVGPLLAAPGALRIRVDATGEELQMESWRPVPIIDRRSRSFSVIAEFSDADRASEGRVLAPGMSVSAWIPTGDRKVHVSVSADAVLRNDTGTFMYLAQPSGEGEPSRAVPTAIEVLFRLGDRVVLMEGSVAEGALAIVEGNERLFSMAPVQVVEAR